MKLKIFLMIAILMVSAITMYGSFPVQSSKQTNETTITSNVDEMTSAAVLDDGKSQLIALLLAVFVGGIGIHRFYLGYTWQGVVQLLTFGGCGIWALIDLIRIATGDLQPKNGSYTKTL